MGTFPLLRTGWAGGTHGFWPLTAAPDSCQLLLKLTKFAALAWTPPAAEAPPRRGSHARSTGQARRWGRNGLGKLMGCTGPFIGHVS